MPDNRFDNNGVYGRAGEGRLLYAFKRWIAAPFAEYGLMATMVGGDRPPEIVARVEACRRFRREGWRR